MTTKQHSFTKDTIKGKPEDLKKRGDETFKEIKARNRYTYEMSRYAIILATVSTVFFLFNVSSSVYFMNQNVPPGYIPTDNEMRYFPPTPLSQFDKSDADIQTFTMDTLSDLFAYDYVNYNTQLAQNQDNFTAKGWENFIDRMNKSFTLVLVKKNRWISSYSNASLPKIVGKGVDPQTGVAFWYVESTGTITYTGYDNNRVDNVNVKMKIERVSTLEKETGIGISNLVFEFKK